MRRLSVTAPMEQALRARIVGWGWFAILLQFGTFTGIEGGLPAPDFQFRKVADTQSAIPEGQGTFVTFNSAVISGGEVAFLAGGANDQFGLYIVKADLSQIVRVADGSTIPPEAFVPIDEIVEYPYSIAQSTAYFAAFWGEEDQAILEGDGTGVDVLVDWTFSIPEGVGDFEFVRDVVASGPFVAFIGQGESGQVGIYLIENGNMTRVADAGMVAPGGTAMFRDFILTVANDRGNIAFEAQSDSTRLNIYAFVQGQLRLVLPAQVQSPEGIQFTTYDGVPDISGQTVVFKGFKGSGKYGLYSVNADGTGLTRLMDRDQAPPVGTAQSFDAMVSYAYSNGLLLFLAGENGGTSAGLYSSEHGVITKILRHGDSLDGKIVAGLRFTHREGLDGRVFCVVVTFADATEAIYRGTVSETTAPPVLTFVTEGENIVLSWPGNYALQATSVIGNSGWTPVATSSPATLPISSDSIQFFRLVAP